MTAKHLQNLFSMFSTNEEESDNNTVTQLNASGPEFWAQEAPGSQTIKQQGAKLRSAPGTRKPAEQVDTSMTQVNQ